MVIGASGFLGSYLAKEFGSNNEVIGTGHRQEPNFVQLDLAGDVNQVLEKFNPELVILSAGVTNMDLCEEKPTECREVNVEGTSKVVAYCKKNNAVLVFYSSDAVFDGKNGPYSEDYSPLSPTSQYAKQKVEAEQIVSQLPNYLIIRTSSVYGWDPRNANFVARLFNNLSTGKEVTTPVNQSYTPTYAPDLATATHLLIENQQRGIFNVTGSTFISRYDFALLAAEVFGFDKQLVKGVKTAELNQKAPRLEKGGLTCDKLFKAVKFRPRSSREGLRDMLILLNNRNLIKT